tara:strand:- start:38 stop:2473 length:2436 start_codon:yes stop_codon:yes gene_type:complete
MFSSDSWLSNPASGFYPHTINQSLRFEDGDSPKLSKTYGSAGNRRLFTLSGWFKRGELGATNTFYGAGSDGSNYFKAGFFNDDTLYIEVASSGTNTLLLVTTQVFRDVSAWYHIQYVIDTAQSTDTNRIKIYVNGSQITSFSTATYYDQNDDFEFWTTDIEHQIGQATAASVAGYDGYIAELCYLDGTAALPASFGETKDGIWVPKNVSGLTFGTNGFHLDFANSSAIGNDVSGKDNDYTVSGGGSPTLVASDIVLDSPTNNFATYNPLVRTGQTVTYAEGNLAVTASSAWSSNVWRQGSIGVTGGAGGGKYYFEFVSTLAGNGLVIGVGVQNSKATSTTAYTQGVVYYNTVVNSNGSSSVTGITRNPANDVLRVAFDASNGKVWIGNSGGYFNSGNPTNGSGEVGTITNYDGSILVPITNRTSTGGTHTFNFGQDSSFAGLKTSGSASASDANGQGDFFYAPPSGFLALCSANLPEPSIIDGSEYFDTVLYTGNSGDKAITSLLFQPDFVWGKSRSNDSNHRLHDSVRGPTKTISSNSLNDEETNGLVSFDANGFTMDSGTNINQSITYVAWNWLAGGSASLNENGTVDSQVSANPEAGFSIATYTGGAAAYTVGHGLTKPPEIIFTFNRTDNGGAHYVFTTAVDGTIDYLSLNASTAKINDDFSMPAFTNTVFSLDNDYAMDAGDNCVAYCFHSVEGFSKVGVYTGNGNADGTFIHTGFRPAWVMIKETGASGFWMITDNKVYPTNDGNTRSLAANDVGSETTISNRGNEVDFLSNGFKIRASTGDMGASNTHIFLAFAEQPFKYSNAR